MDPKYSHILIAIESIDLHIENPRFDPVEDQRAAIKAVCEDQKDKLVVLAEHIAKNGISPIELMFVVKAENDERYISVEGNRRLTALKLLAQPMRIDEVPFTDNQKKKLKAASKLFHSEQESEITCALAPDYDSASEWIRLRHTGENEGAGIVQWTGTATGRFNNSEGHSLINFVRKQLGTGFDDSILERFPISTFERLIYDPDIRAGIGLSLEDGKFFLEYNPKLVAENLYSMMNDLRKDLGKASTVVTDVKTKDQRIDYLTKLKSKLKLSEPLGISVALDGDLEPDISSGYTHSGVSPIEDGDPVGEKVSSKISPTSKAKKSKPSVKNRSILIPRGTTFPVDSTRVNEIYRELRTLNIIRYPNAGAVLARVFLECSADAYIQHFKLKKDLHAEAGGAPDAKPTLKHKLTCVKKHLISNGADKTEINSAHHVFISATSPFSVQHLHLCVHDKNWHPDGPGLIRDWDTCSPFFVEVWNRIQEDGKKRLATTP